MSDQTTAQPIVVAATPAKPQLAAGIRQAAGYIGVIAAGFGLAEVAKEANIVVSLATPIAELLALVGPVVAVGAAWLGQLATRAHAKKAAAMANLLPDNKAVTK